MKITNRDKLGRILGESPIKHICRGCGNVFVIYKSHKRVFCSRKCYWKHMGRIYVEQNASHWKGDNIKYGAIHRWVRKTLGKPTKCENPQCVYPRRNANRSLLLAPKTFHWANKSGSYLRDINDWFQLCPSCHKKYDVGTEKRLKH